MNTLRVLFQAAVMSGLFALSLRAAPLLEVVAASTYGPYLPAHGELFLHSDGNFYGTTQSGGTHGDGVLFRVTPSGSVSVAHSFGPFESSNGMHPHAGLVSDGGDYLWGTTAGGGTEGDGTIFKYEVATGKVTRVVDFTTTGAAPGRSPDGDLIDDGNGFFWGTTTEGGNFEHGTVFKVNATTGALTTLVHFTGISGTRKGSRPTCTLVSDGVGYFWGITREGGSGDFGTLFKVRASNGAFTHVLDFTGTVGPAKGSDGVGGLVRGGDDFLWGTTLIGGANDLGTVFKVSRLTTGALTTVVEFTGTSGTAIGARPGGRLLYDGANTFYSTTLSGGSSSSNSFGSGTIFKVNETSGAHTPIINFGTPSAPIGRTPTCGLTSNLHGTLWGVTQGSEPGGGSIYKLNPTTGVLTTMNIMYRATSGLSGPGVNGVIRASDGLLWGTTSIGGNFERGSVFKVNDVTGDAETIVHFTHTSGIAKGSEPYSNLCEDGLGFLWGTTAHGGGATNRGTVFKVNMTTGAFTSIAEFTGISGAAKGSFPSSELVRDNLGYLWGTTSGGGASDFGTVFIVAPNSGGLNTVIEFTGTGGLKRGSMPSADLVKDGNGILWGTTVAGGSTDQGTIFKIDPVSFAFTTVVTFTGASGAVPGNGGAPLRIDGSYIRGATRTAGSAGFGSLFQIHTGTGAFAFGPSLTASAPLSLLPDSSGFLWGARTSVDEPEDLGTLCKVNPATGEVTAVFQYTNTEPPYYGFLPSHRLLSDGGHFYGGAYNGGPGGAGLVYRLRFGPAPVTLAATSVLPTSAQLNGTVNPNGPATHVAFEWGTSPALGNVATTTNLAAGISPVPVSVSLTGLAQNTTYYFRARAGNSDNPNLQRGSIQSFTTLSPSGTWRLTHLGNANASLLADPDGDGLLTLAEYGLNLLPEKPDLGPQGSIFFYRFPILADRLRMFVPRDPEHNDITVLVQAASNFAGPWTTLATSTYGAPFSGPGYVGGDDATPGIKNVEIRDTMNVSAAARRYMRVKVME